MNYQAVAGKRPIIMGVLNVTPDSFSDGGRFQDPGASIAHARQMILQGAAIIDIGGESTRPGAKRVPLEQEQERVLPVIEALSAENITTSIDTMNAATAALAVAAGASLINDVSGGLADPLILNVAAQSGAEIALGHWRAASEQMYQSANYDDVTAEVKKELFIRAGVAEASGISPAQIILDIGIGFNKTPEQNWQLLEDLREFTRSGYRILIGTSRKRFLRNALQIPDNDAGAARLDAATAVTSVLAGIAGAWGVRVHNVAATADALEIASHAKTLTQPSDS